MLETVTAPRDEAPIMKSYPVLGNREPILPKAAWLALWAAVAALSAIQRSEADAEVVLWDTIAPLADAPEGADRSLWKPVPGDLLTVEADPPKASSDPGYYGRDYSFKGDAVVENRYLAAVFWSAKGSVVIYSKDDAPVPGGTGQANARLGRKIVELVPLGTGKPPAPMGRLDIVRNAGDEVALRVSASARDSGMGVLAFGKTQIIEIQPATNAPGMSLRGPIEFGIVPSFVGDDLVFSPTGHPSAKILCIPSENFFLGLLPGGDGELVMTWPRGEQQLRLQLGADPQGKRRIESLDFKPDSQSFYLAALRAPGLWHREALSPSYLEKDMTIDWKRPFPARWKTQLAEEGVKTSFAFRASKGQIWRGVAGSYDYPVWFDGEAARFHLSKKVAPGGESLIYCVEGQNTPPSVTMPVDILQATLGRPMCEPILDRAGRKLRTHHRRGGEGVRRACTCGCTEAIQAVFEAGEEVARKGDIEGALEDMIFFVHQHVERIDEYRRFADAMSRFLQAQGSGSPELKPYVDELEEIVRQIPQEYSVQKENMKSFGYADELARQTLALTNRKAPNNLKAYLDLLKAWRDMGGAQDYVLAQCHTITRRLCQQAGYSAVNQPRAAALAAEIRTRCRQCLRNPDGYEIWADY
jgi:hypothetical protein